MGFTSLAFLAFFPIVWLIYLALPGRARAAWLLAASYVFCLSFGIEYLLVLLGSTLVTWLGALGLEKRRNISEAQGRLLFGAVIVFHVAALSFFKYNRLGLLLPVGISFYTFQAIGYLADVWKGRAEAEKNLLRFALFQAFFPKLVQGPIERSGNLLAQIRELPGKNVRDIQRIRNGGLLILWGLCEKLLIADRIAVPVNAVYSQFGAFGGVEIVLTTVLYAFQIYCDFAGYTDIARGTAQILGFDLLANFQRPYLADSVQDFWRRWHQSLSSWLRDYLYIPLGGNRCSAVRNIVNLMIVWTFTGMWHGAAWNFIVWGVYYGVIIVMEKYVYGASLDELPKPVRHIYSLVVILIGWVFFFSPSIGYALRYLAAMFGGGAGIADKGAWFVLLSHWLLYLLAVLGSTRIGFSFIRALTEAWKSQRARTAASVIVYFGMFFISIAYLVTGSYNPFLYFRF